MLRIWVRCCVLGCALGFVAGLVGCGGPPPPPVSIQMNVTPPPSGYSYLDPDMLSATISNAQSSAVNWQVSCDQSPCGNFTTSATSNEGVATNSSSNGQSVYYYPPNAGVITVTFTATSVADPTKTASATITRGYATALNFSSVPSLMPVQFSTSVAAKITADPIELQTLEKEGYTWTVTCGSKDCGTFSNAPNTIPNSFSSDSTTAWGIANTVQYNSPATVPSGGTVTITVTLGAPAIPAKGNPSASSAVTITTLTN